MPPRRTSDRLGFVFLAIASTHPKILLLQGKALGRALKDFWTREVVPAITNGTVHMFTAMLLRFVRVQRLVPSYPWIHTEDYTAEKPFFLSDCAHREERGTLQVSLDVSGFGEKPAERRKEEGMMSEKEIPHSSDGQSGPGGLMGKREVLMRDLNEAIAKLKPHPGDSTAVELVVGAVLELLVALVQVLNYDSLTSHSYFDPRQLDSLYALFMSGLGNRKVLEAMAEERKELVLHVTEGKAKNREVQVEERKRAIRKMSSPKRAAPVVNEKAALMPEMAIHGSEVVARKRSMVAANGGEKEFWNEKIGPIQYQQHNGIVAA